MRSITPTPAAALGAAAEPLAALLGTAAASAWFWAHPMALVVGLTPQPQLVPWWYQAAAFPPFCALLVRALRDPPRRRATLTLVLASAALAAVRLARWIPLSGHGLFLAAAVVFTWPSARQPPARFVLGTALAGLVLTGLVKWTWGDLGFFLASVVAGAAVGGFARRDLPNPVTA